LHLFDKYINSELFMEENKGFFVLNNRHVLIYPAQVL